MKKQIIILIIFLFLFFVPSSVDGFQSSKNRDVPIELMPKKQKDLCIKCIELKTKYTENSKNKTINAVVKKETALALEKEFKELLNNTNEDFSSNGFKDWVGTVLVNSSSIELYVYVKTNSGTRLLTQQLVHTTIPTTGMNKNVLDTVKTLTTGDLVKFSIENTKEFDSKFTTGGIMSSFYNRVKPSNLTSLVLVK